MSKEMKQLNKNLDRLQSNLLKQLQSTKIEYIDLLTYYNQVNNLKIKKNTLFLNDDD